MSDQRPNLARVSPRMSGRGAPLPSRTAVVVVVVALAAFMAGLQISPSRVVVPAPPPSGAAPSSLPATIPATTPATTPATPAPTGTSVVPSSPLPAGMYHLTQVEANEIAIATRFYAAYNAGQLALVMSLLSAQPRLVDCDYATHTMVTIDGRSAIETYLRARFAEHDRWVVEYYQENPANTGQVVVLPLQRSSDTLLRLGAPGGVKRAFPEVFYLAFGADRSHLDVIAWNTMSGSVGPLCGP